MTGEDVSGQAVFARLFNFGDIDWSANKASINFIQVGGVQLHVTWTR